MNRHLFAGLLMTAVSFIPGYSAADSLFVGGWSKHFIKGEFNEKHNLLAYQHGDWIGGVFKNSFGRTTLIAGYDVPAFKFRSEYFDAGVIAAVTRGYTRCFGEDGSAPNVCPLPVPYLDIKGTNPAPRFLLFGPALGVTVQVRF